jgi:hypothetical protein
MKAPDARRGHPRRNPHSRTHGQFTH